MREYFVGGVTGQVTKILMMGPPASGKTSIRYCFFKGLKPEVVLGSPPDPTYREEERFDHFDFLLRIIDLGGQESFMGAWSKGEKEKELFTAVDTMIFVVDAADQDHRNMLKAVRMLQRVAFSTLKYSPQAKIHILLHKMDIVKSADTATELKEELMKVITDSQPNQESIVSFHETSIVDGTANRALRAIINEAMPAYFKISGLFQKAINENKDVELIQLLASSRAKVVTGKGHALIVSEAITPDRKVDGSGVRKNFAPLIRRLNEAVGELGEGKVEYFLMTVETGKLIILKDLGEYSVVMESKKEPNEKLFLESADRVIKIIKDVTNLTTQDE
jgi:Ras-related GTP-binding protein A/B